MPGEPIVLIIVAAGAIRLAAAVVSWLAERSGERTRARTLTALLRLAGPGATLIDRRADGASLTVRGIRGPRAEGRSVE